MYVTYAAKKQREESLGIKWPRLCSFLSNFLLIHLVIYIERFRILYSIFIPWFGGIRGWQYFPFFHSIFTPIYMEREFLWGYTPPDPLGEQEEMLSKHFCIQKWGLDQNKITNYLLEYATIGNASTYVIL